MSSQNTQIIFLKWLGMLKQFVSWKECKGYLGGRVGNITCIPAAVPY